MDLVRVINPSNEEVLGEYSYHPESETALRLERAQSDFLKWKMVPLSDRLKWLSNLAGGFKAKQVAMAELISLEMGKPLAEAKSEVNKCIQTLELLVELYPTWLSNYEIKVKGFDLHLAPLGPVLGIMPWNFPLWQVIRFAAPAILGGNVVLLKHAPNVWGVAHLIESIFKGSSDFALFQGVFCDVKAIEKILESPIVRGVSLTGSRRAGVSVAEMAGRNLKKCVLELGGSDAYLVLEDADVELAARTCAKSRMLNAGQSCISPKRLLVHKKIASKFQEALVDEVKRVKVGDPFEPATRMGPMARKDLRDGLKAQVEKSIEQGSRLVLGGEAPNGPGYFYQPTVLAQVKPGQVAFDEELFGPVATVIEFETESQGIALANQSIYGLGGAVFSKDETRARRIAFDQLDTGMVAINDFLRSDVHMNFGGVKDSGLGRELGPQGSFEFINFKAIQNDKN